MEKKQIEYLHELHSYSDLEMLEELKACCDKEDLSEVELLIYLNDTVGIGWGRPMKPEYKLEFHERMDEYYNRKFVLLSKYDTKESWMTD